jgi:hypothetical protein
VGLRLLLPSGAGLIIERIRLRGEVVCVTAWGSASMATILGRVDSTSLAGGEELLRGRCSTARVEY